MLAKRMATRALWKEDMTEATMWKTLTWSATLEIALSDTILAVFIERGKTVWKNKNNKILGFSRANVMDEVGLPFVDARSGCGG